MESDKKQQAYKLGVFVLIILAVLTIGEYGVGAVGVPWTVVFIAIAVMKAWFVIEHYMHISRLFAKERVDHED